MSPEAPEKRGEVLAVDVLHREEWLSIGLADVVRGERQLPGEVEHAADARLEFGDTVVHHQHLAQLAAKMGFAHQLHPKGQPRDVSIGRKGTAALADERISAS